MPVDLPAVFAGGGKPLLDLLQFAVLSARPDVVFVYLAREYRLRPTADGALALYDVFCAPAAPCRLKADALLPPKNPALASAIAPVRAAVERARAPQPAPAEGEDPPEPPAMPVPPNHLFAGFADRLLDDPDGATAEVGREFDPELGPVGSLPGRKLSPSQRTFVEQVWRRHARPVLVAAGFWRVGTIGQV